MSNDKRAGSFFLQVFSSRYFRVGVGVFLGVMALAFTFNNVNIQEVWGILIKAQVSFIGLGLASVGVNILSKVFRWKVLLGGTGQKVGFSSLVGGVFLGQLLNLFIPGRIGDIARAFVIRGETGRAFVLGTIALEKFIETLAFAILFLSLLFFMPLPDWIEVSSVALMVLVGFLSLTLAAAVYYYEPFIAWVIKLCRYFPDRFYEWLTPRLQSGLASLKELERGKSLFWIVVLTMLVWSTAVFNNYVGMRALGITLPISASIILLIGLQTGIVVSASPGAMGVFEAICVFTLVYFGVDRTLALGYSILLHALVLIPQIVGGLCSLVWWGFRVPSP